jgi:hypothetical protein
MPGVDERARCHVLRNRRLGATVFRRGHDLKANGLASDVFYLKGSEAIGSRGPGRNRPCRTPLRGLPQRAPLARVHGCAAGRSRAGGHVRCVSSPLRRRSTRTASQRAGRGAGGPGPGLDPGHTRAPRSRPRRSREKGAPRAAQRRVHDREDRQGRRPKRSAGCVSWPHPARSERSASAGRPSRPPPISTRRLTASKPRRATFGSFGTDR